MTTPAFNSPRKFWFQHSEATLNWVAFGMLLAAWNACDNDASMAGRSAHEATLPLKPPALSAYTHVSVRAYKGHENVKEPSHKFAILIPQR